MKSVNILVIPIFVLIFSTQIIYSAVKPVSGKIIDKETGKPVPGATIKIPDGSKGTYSSSHGKFRLPVPEGVKSLTVTSLGYKKATVNIDPNIDTIVVYLISEPIVKGNVEVSGDITPEELMKRAIGRKEENRRKLKTMEGLLYSKFVLEMDGSLFMSGESTGNSVSVTGTLGDGVPEKYKMFVLESFSTTFNDYEKNISHSHILQRRQTSNITPQSNLLTIRNFFNLYDDEVQIINAKIVTPLSTDALSYYKFNIISRVPYGDKYVYVVEVIPDTELFPTFTGKINIVEGTYDLVEAELMPSENTAITFMEDLKIIQKFEEIEDNVWTPTFLELTGKAKVDIVKGILDLKLDAVVSSIYSDVKVNKPLPDSIYANEIPFITSVSVDADSSKKEFWEENSLRGLSEKERVMYQKVDSIMVMDSIKEVTNEFSWGLSPIGGEWPVPFIEFNRVESVSLYLTPYVTYGNLSVFSRLKYSFGQEDFYWNAGAGFYPYRYFGLSIYAYGLYYDEPGKFTNIIGYPELANTLTSAIFHNDYNDYFHEKGLKAGFEIKYKSLELLAEYNISEQSSLEKSTNKSIFTDYSWRENPAIESDKYSTLAGKLNYQTNSLFSWSGFNISVDISGLYGDQKDSSKTFNSIDGSIYLNIPTFSTGYQPMILDVYAAAGRSTRNTPVQYQLRMPTALIPIGKTGTIYSAPIGIFGGTEYYTIQGEFNTTDLWWRIIGLPKYENRGIDLILYGSTSYFYNESNTFYRSAEGNYSEIGFGLSRVPTFISNVIFLSFKAAWGVGPNAAGNFGWGIGGSLPF